MDGRGEVGGQPRKRPDGRIDAGERAMGAEAVGQAQEPPRRRDTASRTHGKARKRPARPHGTLESSK